MTEVIKFPASSESVDDVYNVTEEYSELERKLERLREEARDAEDENKDNDQERAIKIAHINIEIENTQHNLRNRKE